MEIFSYVVDGKLSHRDSAGNLEFLSRGHAQSISAGTGLTHSELNEEDDWCRFLQIWILPESRNLPVRYDFHKFSLEDRENRLLHIVSSSKNRDQAPLYVCQDINIYVSELTEQSKHVSFELNKGRQAYIFCFEGSVDINENHVLAERDSLEVVGETQIDLTLASEQAHSIIIEMQQEKLSVARPS
jgi:redox-sensitive bicupin YhaK (pirin superfamily)